MSRKVFGVIVFSLKRTTILYVELNFLIGIIGFLMNLSKMSRSLVKFYPFESIQEFFQLGVKPLWLVVKYKVVGAFGYQ
jgi:hypothetical protein